MIKKTVLAVFLGLLAPLWAFGESPLVSAYKSGQIILAPDPGFGRGVDWESLVLHFANDMTVAPDGSIFVANNREHAVLKFDANGLLLKRFGRKGQGPGDFEFPGNLCVLNPGILVVGEYPLNRRISLFGLDGGHQKLLKANHPIYGIAPLREGKLAYVSLSTVPAAEGSSDSVDRRTVFVKEAETGREVKVAEAVAKSPFLMTSGRTMTRLEESLSPSLLIAATKDGNLLVGDTRRAEIDVLDPSGKKLSSFTLKIEEVPVTADFVRRYRAEIVRRMKTRPGASSPGFANAVRSIEETPFEKVFESRLPFYRELLVDSEGNILVFRITSCLGDCPILVQAYSPAGEFVSEFELDPGPFKVVIDSRFRNICFTGGGIIGMFPRRDDPDEIILLVKSAFH